MFSFNLSLLYITIFYLDERNLATGIVATNRDWTVISPIITTIIVITIGGPTISSLSPNDTSSSPPVRYTTRLATRSAGPAIRKVSHGNGNQRAGYS